MLEGPTINAVVRGVQTSFREPYDITSFKSARSDSFEWAIPVQHSMSLLDRKINFIDTSAGDRRGKLPLPTTYLIHDQQSPYERCDMHQYWDRCVVASDPLSYEVRQGALGVFQWYQTWRRSSWKRSTIKVARGIYLNPKAVISVCSHYYFE